MWAISADESLGIATEDGPPSVSLGIAKVNDVVRIDDSNESGVLHEVMYRYGGSL